MKDFNPEEMDRAAERAKAELNLLPLYDVLTVAYWWKGWYLKAGHKRLGRILIDQIKKDKIE